MLVDRKDAKRLYKLIDDVVTYACDAYGFKGLLDAPWDDDSPKNMLAISYRLFNGDRREEILDDYIRDRQKYVSKADLNQVSRWKMALAGEFGLVRVGSDTLLTFDDYVFCVRGIAQEIDTMVYNLPASVSLVILPFEGVLTYCLGAVDLDADPDSEDMREVERQVMEAVEARKVIRSASVFMRTVPKIRADYADYVNGDGIKGATGSRPFIVRLKDPDMW